ncbi:MAG: TIGR04255 family protein [Chitinophagales bacterium]
MFGFPNVDRSEINHYSSNYLKSVVFQIKYETTDSIIKNKDTLTDQFSELLPRIKNSVQKGFEIAFKSDQTPILQPLTETDSGFELRSQNGHKVLRFSKDTTTYTISGQEYKNFENIKNELHEILKSLELCGINKFTRVAIRKINIIEFQIPEKTDLSPMEVMEILLNPDLINNASYFPNTHLIQQNIHTIDYVKDNNRLKLRYGLVLPATNEKIGHVLVDIDRFKVSDIEHKDFMDLATKMNTEIFNIFNWAISKNAIEELKH